ncbi:MAG TPA: ABC transporter permease, partial [Bryobacteraceae bacterium]|nr:ABC transporter permease [Bryobacteraceae bacterium]
MLADLRFAVRSLRRGPGFFAVAVLTFALGISAATAIFSLFYQVLLRSLPVSDPESLVVFQISGGNLGLRSVSSDGAGNVFSYPMYTSLRDGLHSFRGIAARSSAVAQITTDGNTEQASAEVVSGNFFEVLGVHAALGRLLGPADDSVRGGNRVAVISYELWTRRFGRSASILNRAIIVNGIPFTVAGVAPAGFRSIWAGHSPDLYVPLSMKVAITPGWKDSESWGPGDQWMNLFGRLAPGVSSARAETEIAPFFAAVLKADMDQLGIKDALARSRLSAQHIELQPGSQGLNELKRHWQKPLWVLLAMVLLLLLIACANLANLLMARSVSRTREIATRVAVGATPAQILRLALSESLVIAVCGSVLGIALSMGLSAGLLHFLPQSAAGGWLSASVSLPVLGYCIAAMLAATVLFGLAPAIQSARAGGSGLGERSQTSGGLHARVRRLAISGQVAFSLILISTAGLFGRSLTNLIRLQPGFEASGLLTFRIDPGLSGYPVARGLALYRDLTNKLAALPGVESVSWALAGPLSNSESGTNVQIEGYTPHPGEDMDSDYDRISPRFFETLGTRVLAGREFTLRDSAKSPKVAMVNEAFAQRFFNKTDIVGRRMELGASGPLDIQIVGVVEDQRALNLREPAKPTFYLPYDQFVQDLDKIPRADFFVRSRVDPNRISAAVRPILKQVDPTLPVTRLHPMETQVEDSIYVDRLLAALATLFSGLALILTAVGLFGIIAYLVNRRRAEIGIRIALGARPGDIVWLVAREAVVLALAGGAVGLARALAEGRVIQSQL